MGFFFSFVAEVQLFVIFSSLFRNDGCSFTHFNRMHTYLNKKTNGLPGPMNYQHAYLKLASENQITHKIKQQKKEKKRASNPPPKKKEVNNQCPPPSQKISKVTQAAAKIKMNSILNVLGCYLHVYSCDSSNFNLFLSKQLKYGVSIFQDTHQRRQSSWNRTGTAYTVVRRCYRPGPTVSETHPWGCC